MKLRLNVLGKLLLPILSIVLVGLVGIMTFMYLQSSSTLVDQIRDGLNRESGAAGQSLDNWIESRKLDAKDWATDPLYVLAALHDPEAEAKVSARLANKMKTFGYYEALNLLDATGRVVSGGKAASVGLDLSKREYFGKCIQGQSYVSQPFLSALNKKAVVTLGEPVLDAGGRVIGVFTSVVRIESMTSIITDKIQIGEHGYAFLVSREGTIIGHPDKSLIMKEKITDTDYGRVVLRERTGLYRYWYAQQNQWKLMSFREVPSTGWIVVVTAPLDELSAPLVRMRNLAALGGLVTLLLVGLVIFFSIARVTRVVKVAAGHLKRMSAGHLDVEIPERYLTLRDELGELGRSFQTLLESQRARVDLAQSIASGDLTRQVAISSDQDRLGKALDEMVGSLNNVLGQIGAAAEQVEDGSGQVAESSQALSQGATEQASSLEEVTSSLTEVGSQTRTNAENASQANRLASEARDAARKGDSEMHDMVDAMKEINESSQAIGKIIKVIDEIAFQTNLLALNAAVEAARAGAHGKGFAVVAEEVRNLAGRSAKAAQETAQLIEGSTARVDKGGEIATQTADSLQVIVDKITKVADLVADIAAASDEQAKGVGQVNIGLGQIDQVTQQNTANAEETASAAEELSSQAVEMRRLVARFRLAGGASGAPTRARVVASSPTRKAAQLPSAAPARSGRPAPGKSGNAARPEVRTASRPAQARSAETGAWDASPANGAAGVSRNASEVIRPEDVIALDEDEFGRY